MQQRQSAEMALQNAQTLLLTEQAKGRAEPWSYSVDEIFKGDLAIDLTIDYWGVLWGLSDYLMYVDTKVIKWMLLGDFEGVFTFTCLRRAANAG